MLKILYMVGMYNYNISPSSQVILGGMVATFSGNREVGLCSPNMVPVGFFVNDTISINDTNGRNAFLFSTNDMIRIAVGGEFQTDVFEPGIYQVNDFLYCSHNGKISNDPQYRGNIIIGIVNLVELLIGTTHPLLIGFLTCFTRGLDISGGIVPMKKMTRFQILKGATPCATPQNDP